MDFQRKEAYGVYDLEEIMTILRGEGGCPWDREQDHHSIRNNFLEETYEAIDAIDREDPEALREELGDVLLQVVFHAQMEAEKGGFTLDDVADGICKKLILRHPHIFGDTVAATSEEVLRNWDAIKQVEKGQKTKTDTLVSVPKAFPGLMRAQKVQSRAAKAGFDYDSLDGAFSEMEDEVAELWRAIETGERAGIEEELGDLLFAAVNVARFVRADAEEMIGRASDKFIDRFRVVETLAAERGLELRQMTLDELTALWNEAKEKLQG